MNTNGYYIISESSEDRFDEADSLEGAIRIARAVVRERETGEAIAIKRHGRVVRQLIRLPDGQVSEEEIR